jgi:excinuclease ABC subunit C
LSTESLSHLKSKAENLPKKPGIYFFKTKKNEVIYIGKARSLRDRVKSYFLPTADKKIENIVSETEDIDFILTDSDREAAFLENNFIRQTQPKFNIKLKDDKSFPYLKITFQNNYPGIYLTRRVEKDGARYFGPFSPAHQARKTIHLLAKYFGIRTCLEPVPGKRKRPCLEYELELCTAPCVKFISEKEYSENVQNALLFLEGKVDELSEILDRKMREAAEHQEFEQAAHWRDFLFTLDQIKDRPKLISVQDVDEDIFGYARERDDVALYIFLMRKGKVIESDSLFARSNRGVSDVKILSDLILKFYRIRLDIPKTILLPFFPERQKKLLDELKRLKQGPVKFHVPSKGKKKKLIELADKNAANLLYKKALDLNPLTELQKQLRLEKVPRRIEGYDISNTGGEESVGSLAVFFDGKPHKGDYRKYKIKTVRGPDDVSCLREVIHRRYTRIRAEQAQPPDLILVDGGKGQLSAAQKTLKELGFAKIPVVSLAKKEEILFSEHHKNGLRLDRTSPALKLLQRIRDEAHRFAITFHRKRREQRSFSS